MDSEKLKYNKFREKAEELYKNKENNPNDKSWDLDELIYELNVHQIELELQNEELREAQLKLEDSRRKYFDLYNFAPMGYFTLNKRSIIQMLILKVHHF